MVRIPHFLIAPLPECTDMLQIFQWSGTLSEYRIYFNMTFLNVLQAVSPRYRDVYRVQEALYMSRAQARSISCSCRHRTEASGPQTPASVEEEISSRLLIVLF